MEKNLILVRGASGAGKDTFAKLVCDTIFSADDYFMKSGKYEWIGEQLPAAHKDCMDRTYNAMVKGIEKICVTNTFPTEWEMEPYFEMAKKHGYKIFTIIVENRHGSKNIHDVPEKNIEKQKSRFNIKL